MPVTILTRETKRELAYYLLAVLAGAITGIIDVIVNDLLLTALFVVMACMALGIAQPRHSWRWVVVVGTLIPLTELAASVILTVKPSRGHIYGSCLVLLPGFVGAYGGSFLRGVVNNLRQGK
jgi:ABC-type multidrug transport system permease subunit